jgi:hypothetical protein
MARRREHWLKKALRYAVTGAPILAFLGFIATSLGAAWAGKMGWAAIWLCVGWVVLTVGTYFAEPLIDAKVRHRWLATLLVAAAALIVALGIRYGETHDSAQLSRTPVAGLSPPHQETPTLKQPVPTKDTLQTPIQPHKRVAIGRDHRRIVSGIPKPAETPPPSTSLSVTNSPNSIIAPSGGINTIIDQATPEIFSVNEGDTFYVPTAQYCVVNVMPRKSSTPTTIYLPTNPIKNAVIEVRYVVRLSGDGGANMIGIYLKAPATDATFVTAIFGMGESTRVMFDGEHWSAAS